MNPRSPTIAEPVARTPVDPNASPEAFRRLVESMTALYKESCIKAIEATVRTGMHARLHEIRVPTHVIVGAEDRLRRQIALGPMRAVDPDSAAARFAGTVLTPLRLQMLFGVIDQADRGILERQLARAVDIFLDGVTSERETPATTPASIGRYPTSVRPSR